MVGLTIIIFLLGVASWILFAPIVLRIDSVNQVYEVSFSGVAKAWVDSEENDLTLHLKLPMYHYRKKLTSIRFSASKKKRKTKTKALSFSEASRFQNILKSFRLTAFYVSLDTDDYTVNAQLFPIGLFLTNRGFPICINFQGESHLILEVRNTLGRMALAYSKLKKY